MFENALYTVMVGHHEELSSFAKESIESKENLDLKIVEKIEEIANKDISDFYAEKIYWCWEEPLTKLVDECLHSESY